MINSRKSEDYNKMSLHFLKLHFLKLTTFLMILIHWWFTYITFDLIILTTHTPRIWQAFCSMLFRISMYCINIHAFIIITIWGWHFKTILYMKVYKHEILYILYNVHITQLLHYTLITLYNIRDGLIYKNTSNIICILNTLCLL